MLAAFLLIIIIGCLGFFAVIFGLFWVFTAKYKPNEIWKMNHLASVVKDAVLAIFGIFAFMIILKIVFIIVEVISDMMK